MATLYGDLFDELKVEFDADTGAGGLNESGSETRVNHFVNEDDPIVQGATALPLIEVVIRDVEADSSEESFTDLVVEFIVHTHRDRDPGDRNSVTEGIRRLFHNSTSTLATARWAFDGITRLGGSKLARHGQTNRWSERYRVLGRMV